jgi:hypothetical protein
MYDTLTTKELKTLQSMLYEATENAFRAVNFKHGCPDWINHYAALHFEIGQLFIEAGTELLQRLNQLLPSALPLRGT